MYTISRGPSKLVTRRRTGPTQHVDSKFGDSRQRVAPSSVPSYPAPKLIFHRLNGKRHHATRGHAHEESLTAAHEENVKFVNEAWQEVKQQLGESDQRGLGPVQYTEKTPNPSMKNFVPIDLEEWWARRFLANIADLA
ncbi:MAPK regulated corepressor interacting protein 2-like [Scleropages formosus]|uniref:MAPK regulated corepressor interacting protein 2 n=1 Tax=Scleropages formosus TaxID=113540 RepID=A0A8C9RM48_SCLFO|nr:MAPK regulated corepressor interacting protein 2-like [Scleropages formosus]